MNSIFLYGIVYSFCVMAVIAGILCAKKLLACFLTAQGQYHLWFVLFAVAAAPFLPKNALSVFESSSEQSAQASSAVAVSTGNSSESAIQDLAVNAQYSLSHTLAVVGIFIWAAGSIFMLLRILFSLLQTRQLRRSAQEITDSDFILCLNQCKHLLHLKKNIFIGRSPLAGTPVTFGIIRPAILLPDRCNRNDLKYILLHELTHCRQKDALFNLLMQLFFACNWFNPAVWYVIRHWNSDREAACDATVLRRLGHKEQQDYGHAIINLTAGSSAFPAMGMSGSKKQLRRRITQIAAYKEPTSRLRRSSLAILILMMLLVLFLVPPVSALTRQTYEANTGLSITEENLKSSFGNYEGSFVLYDQTLDQYTIYNEKASRTRVSPDSTYKIYSALQALESGTITSDNSLKKWDGTAYSIRQWNDDQDLSSAMKNSVNWYFQSLDQAAGKKQLQRFYDRIHYGNCDLSSGIKDCWMEASLKISPLEQVILLNDLYQNKWGFSQEAVDTVKDTLRISAEKGTSLSGKTGTGMVDGKTVNGWFVGYVEHGSHVYIFAVNIQGRHGASGSRAAQIAREILKEKALLP